MKIKTAARHISFGIFDDKPIEQLLKDKVVSKRRSMLVSKLQNYWREQNVNEELCGKLDTISEWFQVEIKRKGYGDHSLLASIIFCDDGCDTEQLSHVDIAPGKGDGCCLGFVAPEGMNLNVYARSHLDAKPKLGVVPTRLQINPRQAFIFHPNLVHAGCSYQLSNYRIHFFCVS